MTVRHLVSYPKSGRTWIRYVYHQLGIADQVHFHHDGFEFNDGRKLPHDFDLERRRTEYATVDRIVYVRRDPRDVMASLYHQVTGRFREMFQYEGTISDFIRDEYFGAGVLADFRAIWGELAREPSVLTIDYEDCHRDLSAVIRRTLIHFGFETPEQQLLVAIENSTFTKMKELEDSGGFPQPWLRRRNEAPKVRRGVVGGYVNEFSGADIEFMNQVFRLEEPAR